jgi:hypothetical protein
MGLREIGYDGIDWIDLSQDRVQWRVFVDAVMNLRVLFLPRFLSGCTICSFSRRTQLHE